MQCITLARAGTIRGGIVALNQKAHHLKCHIPYTSRSAWPMAFDIDGAPWRCIIYTNTAWVRRTPTRSACLLCRWASIFRGLAPRFAHVVAGDKPSQPCFLIFWKTAKLHVRKSSERKKGYKDFRSNKDIYFRCVSILRSCGCGFG